MVRHATLIVMLSPIAALQMGTTTIHAPAHGCSPYPRAALTMLSPREEEMAKKEAAMAALQAASDKLEELNSVEAKSAPTSWADLGLPPEPDNGPEVPAFLSVAPAVIGGFSVLLFLLNSVGLFGEGPDLDALAEEWSKL